MIVKFGSDGDDVSFQAVCRRSFDGGDHGFFRAGSICEMGKAVKGGKAFQEIAEAQALKKFGHVSLAGLGLELVDGIGQVEVAANGRQIFGQEGLILIVGQFFLKLLPFHLVEVFIDAGDTAELGDELQGRFFADTGDTGNVVGRIPHEGLHFDDLSRCIAVFRFHDGRCDGQHLGNAFLGQVDRNVVSD